MTTPYLYFDHAATTPLHPQVWAAMQPYFLEHWGNSSSQNPWGWQATQAIENARHQITKALGAADETITFTSGATESNNWALKNSIPHLLQAGKTHLLIGNLEHASVREPALWLKSNYPELDIEFLPANSAGIYELDSLKKHLRPTTGLISVMWVQNELGGINPIADIAQFCDTHNILLHCDATQAIGKIKIHLNSLPIHYLSASAHKLYGPKGVGFLYQNKTAPKLSPLLLGGGHESGLRSGTVPTPLIVGLGAAVNWVTQNQDTILNHCQTLRQYLIQELSDAFDDIEYHTPLKNSVPTHLNFGFKNRRLPSVFHHIALSRGSACLGQKNQSSTVLTHLTLSDHLLKNSVRISLGKNNQISDIDLLMTQLKKHSKL